jgi:hypothetical protein
VSCVGDIGGRPNYKLKTVEREDPVYPYEETLYYGDPEAPIEYRVIRLGPEVAANANGEWIIWRGETYVRKTPVLPPDPLQENK